MSHSFKLDIGHEIIEAEYTGIVDFEERMEAINVGMAILQDREYPRIMINLVGAKMQLSNNEKRELAKYISEQHALLRVKTAFLIRCEQTAKQDIDDAVIRSEEFQSKVFYSRAKALEWLSSG